MEVDWALERALRVADDAIEVPVLQTLYDQMKATPVPVDLPELWRRLGVEPHGDSVSLDDAAPLAPLRSCHHHGPRSMSHCAASIGYMMIERNRIGTLTSFSGPCGTSPLKVSASPGTRS